MIVERGADDDAPAAFVGFDGRGRVSVGQRVDERVDFHPVDRVRNHSLVGRAVGFREVRDVRGDDFMFRRFRDDEELLVFFVDFDARRVRNEFFERVDEFGGRVRADVVIAQNRVEVGNFLGVEEFEKFANFVERFLILRADDDRLRSRFVGTGRARDGRANRRKEGRVRRAAHLPTRHTVVEPVFFHQVRNGFLNERVFLFRAPNDERLVVIVVGNLRGRDERRQFAEVIRRRVVVADAVVVVKTFDRVRLVRSDETVLVLDVDRGQGRFRFFEVGGFAAHREATVDRVVRNRNVFVQLF